jgi:hypothetical protein
MNLSITMGTQPPTPCTPTPTTGKFGIHEGMNLCPREVNGLKLRLVILIM